MKTLNKEHLILAIVYCSIFIINIIQSYCTELLPDEAYYWVYSQKMDWGYFDHPPMVAVFIKLSSFLFDGELGVRFVSSISLLITAHLVWKTVGSKTSNNILLFLVMFFSMTLLSTYGFITTPDTPLVLFIALLLFAYKSYLKSKSLLSYLLISIAMTGMLYSKYQAILVIFCIVLSNPKILKDGKLWISGLGTLTLFSPHLLWQLENDFPSIKYHLFERVSNRTYKFEHTLMHFVNMIAIVGFTFPIIYKAFYKQLTTKNLFKKSLIYIVFGFFGLFLFSSFRGRVQAQWLVPISFSLIILAYNYFLENEKAKIWFYRLSAFNIVLIIVARIALANQGFLPIHLDTHGNKKWVDTFQKKYEGKTKYFINSYQNASSYWFYSKEKPYYYQSFTGRKNHFTLLQKDQNLDSESAVFANRGKTKYTETSLPIRGKDSIHINKVEVYKDATNFRFLWTESLDKPIELQSNNQLKGRFVNNGLDSISLNNFNFKIGFRHKKQKEDLTIKALYIIENHVIQPNDTVHITFRFAVDTNINLSDYNAIGIGLSSDSKIIINRISDFRLFTFTP